MKDSIQSNKSIIAMTLDIGNFYHSIDPSFFIDRDFLSYIGLDLDEFELEFSKDFSRYLTIWSQKCGEKLKFFGCSGTQDLLGGIPIGLSIVRIVSNSILTFLDNQIEAGLSPIYYARYVDDLFLVIQDNLDIESQEQLWAHICSRIPAFERDMLNNIKLRLPSWGGATNLELQASKQKSFFLKGRAGADLLENIASQIRDISSERRLMPLPEQLNTTQSAKTLSATDAADEVDSLRRADGLTLRRLGWSVLLRSVSTLARDLKPKDWLKERNDFYDFAHEHVIRPDKILEQLDHLPRLFSLAVSLGDWKQALRMYRETIASIYELERATASRPMKINGIEAPLAVKEVWAATRDQVDIFFSEALIRAYPVEAAEPNARAFEALLDALSILRPDLQQLALLSRETDWSRLSYREHLRLHADRRVPRRNGEDSLYKYYTHQEVLRQFLARSERPSNDRLQARVSQAAAMSDFAEASLLPFLFPTRPYTPEEIALYLPDECVFAESVTAANNWAEYTRAVRGVWVRSDIANDSTPLIDVERGLEDGHGPIRPKAEKPPVVIHCDDLRRPVKLGVTSFGTSDKTWSQAAAGSPDLSPARYKDLAEIVNAAVTGTHKPDYLILPELSVPYQWIRTISGRLLDAGISLIAGLDYVRHANEQIDSSAVLVLCDKRLGYPSPLQIRQRKEQPSPGEEENLFVSHGQKWKEEKPRPKPVYGHNGLFFGILVCSELQNVEYRLSFQGQVDCMIVLSWNKDVETFSSLVDAASFDVHAYIVLVNNLRYGDSRVRRPAKLPHLRDVCRVRGGLNNQLIVVEIDPSKLRAQQSRVKRWPKKNDAYKPAPEGFCVSPARKTVPD